MTQHQPQDATFAERGREFFENNKELVIGIGVVALLVVGFFFYRSYQGQQHEKAAAPLMDRAQEYFRIDSFNLALYGDGANPGFLNIIDDYGHSSAAKLSHFYAGVSFYHLGNVDEAIEYLEDFSSGSSFLKARKYEILGHAYADKDQPDKAANYYRKAAGALDHKFFTPYYLQIAGDYYVYLEEYEDAKVMYEEIESEYPTSSEGEDIGRYLEMVKAKLKNS